MKNTVILLLLFVGAMSAKATAQEVQNGPKIKFEEEVHDYGTINQGANGEYQFTFTNTGNAPLILSDVKGSCACTVPTWPKEPIAPGKSAMILVKYDTKRAGAINKSVTITSNATNEPTKVIRIKGNVLAAPVSGAPVNTGGPSNQ